MNPAPLNLGIFGTFPASVNFTGLQGRVPTNSNVGYKVFLGGLSWNTTALQLFNYFNNFGDVLDAFVSHDRVTGRPRGFGFVIFKDADVAAKVIHIQHTIDRRTVEAKRAIPKDLEILDRKKEEENGNVTARKLFIGGLPPTATTDVLRKYFGAFGTIVDAVVMYDAESSRPRGFGFVTYDSEEAVERVLAQGATHEIFDKKIEVKRAVPRDQMPAKPTPPVAAPLAAGMLPMQNAAAASVPASRVLLPNGMPVGLPAPGMPMAVLSPDMAGYPLTVAPAAAPLMDPTAALLQEEAALLATAAALGDPSLPAAAAAVKHRRLSLEILVKAQLQAQASNGHTLYGNGGPGPAAAFTVGLDAGLPPGVLPLPAPAAGPMVSVSPSLQTPQLSLTGGGMEGLPLGGMVPPGANLIPYRMPYAQANAAGVAPNAQLEGYRRVNSKAPFS